MATSIEGMCVSKRCDRSCSVFAGLLLCQGARYAVRHIYLTSTSLSLSMRLSPSIAHVINHVNDECWFCLLFFDQNCWCEESQLKTAKFKVLLSRESLAHTQRAMQMTLSIDFSQLCSFCLLQTFSSDANKKAMRKKERSCLLLR